VATTRRKQRVELYKSIFLFTFFIYNIYFLWEKTSAWGHSNPATYVLKTEGDYRYGFGCKLGWLATLISFLRAFLLTQAEIRPWPRHVPHHRHIDIHVILKKNPRDPVPFMVSA